jgi:hypothetical protein
VRLAGLVLSAAALIAFAVLLRCELLPWCQDVSPGQRRYVVQRVLFVLGTNTDLPVVQVLGAGVAMRLAARWRRRHVPPEKGSTPTTTGMASRQGLG